MVISFVRYVVMKEDEKMKIINHYCNSMHVYCRLINIGINKKTALKIALGYEKVMHKIIY